MASATQSSSRTLEPGRDDPAMASRRETAVRATSRPRPTLGQKTGLALGGLLLVAAGISALALLSSLRTRELYEDLWAEQLVQARAIQDVEASVLELAHQMTAHLLGSWEGIDAAGPNAELSFATSMSRLAKTALEPDQRRILPEIEFAFRAHLALWPQVLAYPRSARDGVGLRPLVAELAAAHQRTRALCQRLREANERDLRAALAAERRQAGYVTSWIVALSALLVGLAIAVAWLFWRRTLHPLRRMAEELRGQTPRGGRSREADELEELEACLSDFGDEIAQMRVHLSHSDRHLLESDKLATMGRIAAGVAHEIRSPLTALRLRLFSLQRRIEGVDPAQSDNVRVMAEEVTRLDGIVSSFLDLSRPPRVSPQACSLPLLVDKTLEVLRHRIERSELRLPQVARSGSLTSPRACRALPFSARASDDVPDCGHSGRRARPPIALSDQARGQERGSGGGRVLAGAVGLLSSSPDQPGDRAGAADVAGKPKRRLPRELERRARQRQEHGDGQQRVRGRVSAMHQLGRHELDADAPTQERRAGPAARRP